MVRAIHADLLRETEYCGSAGLVMFGIACLDIALWDLLGRAAGWPVHRLLGACRDRIPAYAMVGWLNYSDDEVKAVCAQAVEQGFRAVKIKVGFPTLEEDAHRIDDRAKRRRAGHRDHGRCQPVSHPARGAEAGARVR